ncbi:MAG: FN3 associated domain-containing protein [Acidobacteriaceae bacterium]
MSAPSISPTGATLSGSTPIYVADATPGVSIIYTLDGSTPSSANGATCTPSSTVPCFTLLGGATIHAIAEDSSGNLSTVATQTYTAPASSNPCTGWNPQDLYAPSDYTADQATITSNGATLGADCNGGGYVDYLNTGYGSFGNLIAVAYGRGFQADIRDSLHSGFYNPTQAGIQDGLGTPVTLTLTQSPEGPGGRINIAPYTLPLFLNGGFCFFPLSYYDPNVQNPIPSCNTTSVTDGIFSQELSANISADQQLSSEFRFQGYYEDASKLGNNTASIFKYDFTMTYLGNPGAPGNPGATTWETPQTSSDYSPIYKFGPAATYDNNGTTTPVLNTDYEGAAYDVQAYSDVSNPSSLTSVQLTPTDLAIAQFDAGVRLRLSGGYTNYLTLNSSCNGWNSAQPLNLTQGGVVITAKMYPIPTSSPCDTVVALQNPSDLNAPIIAIYYPQTDPVNAQQVTETNVTNGENVSVDRRVFSYLRASAYISSISTRTINGIQSENQFTEIAPVIRVSGLLAPNHAGPNIDESVSSDMYVLVGSPAQVLTALQNMNQSEGWNW